MGDKLGKYDIIEELGRGGMGVVYRARDPENDREVALKELIMASALPEAEKTETVERFKREGMAATRLKHPNIVTVYEMGNDGDRYFMAMELVDGKSLGHYLEKKTNFSYRQVVEIGVQICSALDYAHRAGIVHRDIKPDNIQIKGNGQVKLMDFGVARVKSDLPGLTQTGTTLGTIAYISPEQLTDSRDVDGRADIFSLGALFYEMLTFKTPFDAGNLGGTIMRIMNETPTPPTQLNPAIPVKLEAVVLKALKKNREDRYQRAAEMQYALQDSLVGEAGAGATIVAPSLDRCRYCQSALPVGTKVCPECGRSNFGGGPTVAQPIGMPSRVQRPGTLSGAEGQDSTAVPPMPSASSLGRPQLSLPGSSGQTRPQLTMPPVTASGRSPLSPPSAPAKPQLSPPGTATRPATVSGPGGPSVTPASAQGGIGSLRSPGGPALKGGTGNLESKTGGLGNPPPPLRSTIKTRTAPPPLEPVASIVASGTVSNLAFVQAFGQGGATSDNLEQPRGLICDSRCQVYVADTERGRVAIFDRAGAFLGEIKGQANQECFRYPKAVAISPQGVLYVVDDLDHRIYRFEPGGKPLGVWRRNRTEDENPGVPGRILIAPDGRIFLSEPNNKRVVVYDSSERQALVITENLAAPSGLAMDSSGRLYVIDSTNALVLLFDAYGRLLTSFGQRGTGAGQFSVPRDISIDRAGLVYVADTLNHRVQVFTPQGAHLFSLGHRGTGASEFSSPEGVEIGPDDRLYVSDRGNGRVQVFRIDR